MITWFQNTLGKHHKWILSGLLGLTIITFVFTIGAVPTGRVDKTTTQRMFLGVNLADAKAVQAVQDATSVTADLQFMQLRSQQQFQAAIFERIALMHLADLWQIPQPSQTDLEGYIKTLPRFQKATGEFDPEAYHSFLDRLQTMAPATRSTIEGAINENWRLNRVRNAVSGPGYPVTFYSQVEAMLSHTLWGFDVAALNFEKFEPTIAPTDEQLKAVYDRDPVRFQRPVAVKASYLMFTAPPSTEQPTPEQLKDFLFSDPTRFPTVKPDSLGDQAVAVTEAWRKTQGALQAAGQARSFYQDLIGLNVPRTNPAFDALLKKYNGSLQPLPPLEHGKPAPKDSPIPYDVLQQTVFNLSPQHFFSDPAVTPDGAVILFFDDMIPASTPPFAEVRDQVLAYYKEQEKTRQFEVRGAELQKQLAQAVADGKSFNDAATALGLTVQSFSDVSFSKIPEGMSSGLVSALSDPGTGDVPYVLMLQKGQVSRMLTSTTEGSFVYVSKRETPLLAPNAPEVASMMAILGEGESNINLNAVLGNLVHNAETALNNASTQTAN